MFSSSFYFLNFYQLFKFFYFVFEFLLILLPNSFKSSSLSIVLLSYLSQFYSKTYYLLTVILSVKAIYSVFISTGAAPYLEFFIAKVCHSKRNKHQTLLFIKTHYIDKKKKKTTRGAKANSDKSKLTESENKYHFICTVNIQWRLYH